jgi:hypothetical protein
MKALKLKIRSNKDLWSSKDAYSYFTIVVVKQLSEKFRGGAMLTRGVVNAPPWLKKF